MGAYYFLIRTRGFMRDFLGGTGRVSLWCIFAGLLIMVLQQTAAAAGPVVNIDSHYSAITTEAGQCSDAVKIGAYDLFGNLTSATSLIPVTLSSGGHVSFYADSACSDPVTSVAILPGSRSVTLYFRGLEPETIFLVGTAGKYGSVVFPMTITPATTPPSAAIPVLHNTPWFVTILLVGLTIIGGFVVLRKRMTLR